MIYLESRLEKNKRRKIQKIKSFFKYGLFMILLILVFIGVNMVNLTIEELNCIDNTNLFDLDFRQSKLDFLGQSYLIDLKVLKFD